MARSQEAIQQSAATTSAIAAVEMEFPGEDSLVLCEDDVLLDPKGNAPLKTYVTSRSELGAMGGGQWRPALRLSRVEEEVCEQRGTVLLLGRSGTGMAVAMYVLYLLALSVLNRIAHNDIYLQGRRCV